MRRQLLVLGDTVVDAVVGYRTWWVEAVDGVVSLRSVTRKEYEWPQGGVIEAECRCRNATHRCGIHAWRHQIVPYTPRMLGILHVVSGPRVLTGEVLLWGEVHVHVKGYRAEHAKPSAFYVTETMEPGHRRVIELAAIQWEVPTVVVGGWPEGVLPPDGAIVS